MLPEIRRLAALGMFLWVGGCSLGLGGLGADTSGGGAGAGDDADAGAPMMVSHPLVDAGEGGSSSSEGGPSEGGPTDGAPPRGPSTDASDTPDADAGTGCTSCLVVPAGWSLVAFAQSQTSPCPAGFDTAPANDFVEGPTVAGACSCGACEVTAAPTCAAGPIVVTVDFDMSGTCLLPGVPGTFSNSRPGDCLTDIATLDATYDARFAAPQPSGGACRAPAVTNTGAITYAARDRACTPNGAATTSCSRGTCQPAPGGAYQACIARPGSVACPAGPFQVAHHVGTSAIASCKACPCTITGSCTGTLTLYTDDHCKDGATPVATGACTSFDNVSFKAYEYAADSPENVGCIADTPPTPPISLVSEATICCADPSASP